MRLSPISRAVGAAVLVAMLAACTNNSSSTTSTTTSGSTGSSTSAPSSGGGSAQTIKIGIDLPVSGADASIGIPTQNGAVLAIEEANKNGFAGAATGEDRIYGDKLAGWFVGNADRLGVLYVIWFRQIWTPAAKWHAYSSAGGDPASDHTNHVHLSVL